MKTGFSPVDLDAGGFDEGKVYAVRGSSGTGKTVFGLQYLIEGLKRDEPGVLVTSERPEDVLSYAQSLGFHLGPGLQSGRLTLLAYPPHLNEFAHPSLHFGLEEILRELLTHGRETHAKRWVIDTINPLFSFARGLSSPEFGRSMASIFAQIGGTVLLLEDTAAADCRSWSAALEPSLSGLFELAHEGQTLRRIFRIKKLKKPRPASLEFPFHIRHGDGLRPVNDRRSLDDPAPRDAAGDILPAFRQKLILELRRAKRCNHPLSVLIFSSADAVKSEPGPYEDTLNNLLKMCRRHSREFDTVAKYNRDSLIAVLPCADRIGADLYAQKIQRASQDTGYVLHTGIATYPHDAEEEDVLVHKALLEIGTSSVNGNHRG